MTLIQTNLTCQPNTDISMSCPTTSSITQRPTGKLPIGSHNRLEQTSRPWATQLHKDDKPFWEDPVSWWVRCLQLWYNDTTTSSVYFAGPVGCWSGRSRRSCSCSCSVHATAEFNRCQQKKFEFPDFFGGYQRSSTHYPNTAFHRFNHSFRCQGCRARGSSSSGQRGITFDSNYFLLCNKKSPYYICTNY